MGIVDYKKKLRKEVLRRKKSLSEDVYVSRCRHIEERAIKLLENLQCTTFHAYLPIFKNREPDTFGIIKHFYDLKARILISRSNFETHEMEHFMYDEKLELVENKFGIPEPLSGTVCKISEVDAIVMPLVSFDKKGNRLGYGQGFYDRLLEKSPTDIVKIGLSIGGPFDRFDFVEEHDKPLDYCVTPFEIKKFL